MKTGLIRCNIMGKLLLKTGDCCIGWYHTYTGKQCNDILVRDIIA